VTSVIWLPIIGSLLLTLGLFVGRKAGYRDGQFDALKRQVNNHCGYCGGLGYSSRQIEMKPCTGCKGSGQQEPRPQIKAVVLDFPDTDRIKSGSHPEG
jgi:hypothetical protein